MKTKVGEKMKKDKLNPNAANLIEEVLYGNERIAHILQQPFPSTDPQGRIADDDFEYERS